MGTSILSFVTNYLSELHIQATLTEDFHIGLSSLDLGLRDNILKLKDTHGQSPLSHLDEGCIYHVKDYYGCFYSFFLFPGERKLFFAGPYLTEEASEDTINALMEELKIPAEQFPQLRDYFNSLPLLPAPHFLHLLLRQLYQELSGGEVPIFQTFDLKKSETKQDFLANHEFLVPKDPLLSMHLLEERYQLENAFLDAVAEGSSQKALSAAEHFSAFRISPRSEDSLRNAKNMFLVLNTLMRRTAYEAGVHPLYIDEISGNYARMIEQCRSEKEITDIPPYMIRSYCNLVEKRSLSDYSEPIRQILVTIDASLTADLSLKRFAEELFLNTSYLSSLFKKEMGMTLTDYVNHCRLTYAKKLLKSTTLSIQNIALQSGFSDIHYFTRLFRRENGVTPREWRQTH